MCPVEVLKCAPDYLRQVDNIDLSIDITLWGCQPVLKSAPDSLVWGWKKVQVKGQQPIWRIHDLKVFQNRNSGKRLDSPMTEGSLRKWSQRRHRDTMSKCVSAIWRHVHVFVGEYWPNIVMSPELMWAMLAQNWAFLHKCKFPVYWTKLKLGYVIIQNLVAHFMWESARMVESLPMGSVCKSQMQASMPSKVIWGGVTYDPRSTPAWQGLKSSECKAEKVSAFRWTLK